MASWSERPRDPDGTRPDPAGPPPGSGVLLLVPTELERRRLFDRGGLPSGLAQVECCGFGPVAAAARTAELLGRLRPARVLLVGIAGSFDAERHPVGCARSFGAVAIDGVGVGRPPHFVAPPELGFPQWPGSEDTGSRGVTPIYDRIELAGEGPLLLTTCAASADADEADERLDRFGASAEDMEGFAVATACALAGARLEIVRGMSNRVGDRDPGNWRIPTALAAARELALDLLAEGARRP